MQYVGRFMSTVYNTITPNINPATLSGAIDVIVVERQVEREVDDDGQDDNNDQLGGSGVGGGDQDKPKRKKKVMVTELASTPFHVRFGKMSVLRPAERKVTLHLNNSPDPLPFAMKVGEAGEAFFVLELDDDEASQGIPADLVTSPILSATTSPVLAGGARHSPERSATDPGLVQGVENLDLTENHRAPRKLIQEDYVEPLDLGDRAGSISHEPRPDSVDKKEEKDDGTKSHFSNGKADATEEKVEDQEVEAHDDDDEVPTLKTSRKAALEYMLDMDGYKMTEDGEELAYAEGSRLADEIPMSKRHGKLGGAAEQLGVALPSQTKRRGSFGDVEGKETALAAAAGRQRTSTVGGSPALKRRDSFSNDSMHLLSNEKLLYTLEQGKSVSGSSDQRKDITASAQVPALDRLKVNGKPNIPNTLGRTHTDPDLDIKPVRRDEGPRAPPIPPSPPRRAQTESEVKPPQKTYAKTLRLTSDQLKSLNLRKGANTITFSVTSSYSGVATCAARIFLWDGRHQIVVSDIDGTITKSDALGHVFTMIGRDWTHSGVAKLYTDIARNGYRIMYLTSRAIGQADTTRDYLRGITQNNFRLPDGPVIMSPDRLMASLHREVILRKPEVFKMACLRDIARLFGADPRTASAQPGNLMPGSAKEALAEIDAREANGVAPDSDNAVASGTPGTTTSNHPTATDGAAGQQNTIAISASKVAEMTGAAHPTPFYAGFGNRITDALSYRSVNIPSSRIFTIDSNGEVKMELLELAGYKSSYIHMTDLVDQMFPPITAKTEQGATGKPEYNDFNYWRSEISEFELPSDEELSRTPLGSSPVSPALSARSVRSTHSVRSSASTTKMREYAANGGPPADVVRATTDDNNAGATSRLSRFGLGKLGLSRKGSTQTIAGPTMQTGEKGPASDSASTWSEPTNSDAPSGSTLVGASPPSSPSSFSSGVTSWTSGWRRRAASPGAQSGTQATSPLVGPVISAEPEDVEEDDDVSSFGGDEDEDGDDDDEDEEDEGDDDVDDENDETGQQRSGELADNAASRRSQRRRAGRRPEVGADAVDDDDPLLATGDIQFEWRG